MENLAHLNIAGTQKSKHLTRFRSNRRVVG